MSDSTSMMARLVTRNSKILLPTGLSFRIGSSLFYDKGDGRGDSVSPSRVSSGGPEFAQRPARLAHQQLGVAAHDVVLELADQLVAETQVEALRSGVEGRDAKEDVRRVAEDPLLGEGEEPPAQPAVAVLGSHADRLDIADERTLHEQDDEARDLLSDLRHVDLARGIAEKLV